MKPFIVIIIAVVLIVGISAVALFVLIKPQQQKIATLKDDVDKAEQVWAKKVDAEQKLSQAKEQLEEARRTLEQARAEKGIRMSLSDPQEAMIAMWFEMRHNTPPLLQKFITKTGCEIVQGSQFPAPAMSPPTALQGDLIQIPPGGSIPLTVRGSMGEIENLYRSLKYFPRILTIDQLTLNGQGEELESSFTLRMYAMIETGPGGAPAPAAASPGGMPGGMPGMPGAMPGAMPPGEPAAPAAPPPAGGDDGGAGDE
jgi:Tfp pilus assembly protein PilO